MALSENMILRVERHTTKAMQYLDEADRIYDSMRHDGTEVHSLLEPIIQLSVAHMQMLLLLREVE